MLASISPFSHHSGGGQKIACNRRRYVLMYTYCRRVSAEPEIKVSPRARERRMCLRSRAFFVGKHENCRSTTKARKAPGRASLGQPTEIGINEPRKTRNTRKTVRYWLLSCISRVSWFNSCLIIGDNTQ
jgi:hypothetical protein